jgi:hypothetical protein
MALILSLEETLNKDLLKIALMGEE